MATQRLAVGRVEFVEPIAPVRHERNGHPFGFRLNVQPFQDASD